MIVFLCDEPQGCFHQNNMAAELTTSLFSLRLLKWLNVARAP